MSKCTRTLCRTTGRRSERTCEILLYSTIELATCLELSRRISQVLRFQEAAVSDDTRERTDVGIPFRFVYNARGIHRDVLLHRRQQSVRWSFH